jgi:hypothetical protein
VILRGFVFPFSMIWASPSSFPGFRTIVTGAISVAAFCVCAALQGTTVDIIKSQRHPFQRCNAEAHDHMSIAPEKLKFGRSEKQTRYAIRIIVQAGMR